MFRFAFFLVFVFVVNVAQAKVDKLRLIWNDDPATTMTIGWNQANGKQAVVEYQEKKDDVANFDNAEKARPSRITVYKNMYNYFTRLKNLQPNTSYWFRITDSEGTSKTYWFTTAPDNEDARLSFIAGGDSRSNSGVRQNGNRMVAKLNATAILFAGDMTHHSYPDEWKKWFDDWQLTVSENGRMTPIIAARGNHEYSNSDIYLLFDVPSSRIYYSIGFCKNLFRVFTLNTEITMTGTQTRWLRKDLEQHKDVVWKVAQYHKPVRPHIARKAEGVKQYKKWVPLFEKYKVRVAIECDSHTHKITFPIKSSSGSGNEEGFVRDDKNGIVYVGEGCWGAPLQNNDDLKSWTRDSYRVNQFKWMFVDKNTVELRTVEFDNVNETGALNSDTRFDMPSNIKLRVMGDTDVVVLQANPS